MKQISFKKHRFTPENKRGPKPQHRAHRAVPDRLKRIAGRGFRLGTKCHGMIKLARRLDLPPNEAFGAVVNQGSLDRPYASPGTPGGALGGASAMVALLIRGTTHASQDGPWVLSV